MHLLPIFTDAVYEKASDETIQKVTKDLQGHVLPPKETAMVILQELHRIASIELYSKEYYTEKFFSESVYCDFHKTYVTRMVGLLTFLRNWVTSLSKDSIIHSAHSILSMLRWSLSICSLCVTQCKPNFLDDVKDDLKLLKELLLVSLPACTEVYKNKYGKIVEEIAFSCRKIVFSFPYCFFEVCGSPSEAIKHIMDAFLNNECLIRA